MEQLNNTEKALLDLLGNALFNKTVTVDVNDGVYEEAISHAVLPLVYSVVPSEEYKNKYNSILANNIRVAYEHSEAHTLLANAAVPYVILKGCASAYYYTNPLLRSMGDVDFLVERDNCERVETLLKQYGFSTNCDYVVYDKTFTRSKSVWELHWGVSGTPEGEVGTVIQKYLNTIISDAVLVENENGSYYMPSAFHHCLVLLLHCAHHLIGGGIGLRHLCDWAAFVDKVDVGQWKKELEECGLFTFASLLTAVSSKYLGSKVWYWVEEYSEDLLLNTVRDVLDAGNFGRKDDTRETDGLFMATEDNSDFSSSPTKQLIKTAFYITTVHWPISKKIVILKPIGAVFFGTRYFVRSLLGKRQKLSLKNKERINNRKSLYSQYRLFKTKEHK